LTSSLSQAALRISSAVFLLALAVSAAQAQQTIFNVPSGDIMEAGKTYFEWDATVGDTAASASFTPRTVRGIGHNIEVGLNVPSADLPNAGTLAVVPTVKWKFYDNASHTFDLFAGNDVYLPIKRRTYGIGDSFYVEAAKSLKAGTRVTAGVYDFSARVMDHANRAGVVAALEQTISPRLGMAVDWYSGNNSMGFVTPGTSFKATSTVTIIAAYQVGNHDLMQGNHSLLLVVGWNPVWKMSKR
jgi:hypothetical protein